MRGLPLAALLAAHVTTGMLAPVRRSRRVRVVAAASDEDYVNPVTEFLGKFIPKQAPVVLDVDWDKAKTPLPLGELAEALDRGLRANEWFVTGRVLPELFADDFKFEDPDVSLTGIQNYAEGVARLFGADARCEVIACQPRGEEIAVDWRLSGSVRVGPGATIKPYVVHTTFRVRDGLVVFQEDAFSIPGWQILLGVLLPGLPIPEAAPPVEELRRRAGT